MALAAVRTPASLDASCARMQTCLNTAFRDVAGSMQQARDKALYPIYGQMVQLQYGLAILCTGIG